MKPHSTSKEKKISKIRTKNIQQRQKKKAEKMFFFKPEKEKAIFFSSFHQVKGAIK